MIQERGLRLDSWLLSLCEVVRRLASEPDEQIAYLTRLGVAPSLDELALEFEDVYSPLQPLIEAAPEGTTLAESLRALNSALSVEALGWAFDNIRDPAWSQVRTASTLVLRRLNPYMARTDAGKAIAE